MPRGSFQLQARRTAPPALRSASHQPGRIAVGHLDLRAALTRLVRGAGDLLAPAHRLRAPRGDCPARLRVNSAPRRLPDLAGAGRKETSSTSLDRNLVAHAHMARFLESIPLLHFLLCAVDRVHLSALLSNRRRRYVGEEPSMPGPAWHWRMAVWLRIGTSSPVFFPTGRPHRAAVLKCVLSARHRHA